MSNRYKYFLCAAVIMAHFYGGLSQTCRELVESHATAAERKLFGVFTKVIKCERRTRFSLIPYLWIPVTVNLDCPRATISVYVDTSPDALLGRYEKKQQKWCNLLGSGCQVLISPFDVAYIGVIKTWSIGGPCQFTTEASLSGWMLGSFLIGLVLFLFAQSCSESLALRVTSGGLLFAIASGLIVVFILARRMPGIRRIPASFLLLASSSLGLFRWLTGFWYPSINTLIHSPWLMAWTAIWGLIGAAFTYVSGAGMDNPRLTTLLMVFFRLLGLVLVYGGTWTHQFFFASVLVVALTYWLMPSTLGLPLRWDWREPAELEEPSTWRQRIPEMSPWSLAPKQPPAAPDPTVYSDKQPYPIHDLVRGGFILGPACVAIPTDGDEFQKLVEAGYIPDLQLGRLLPPPRET